jgi:hypothetical protein
MGHPVHLHCVGPEISLPFSHVNGHWTIFSATRINFKSNVLLFETRRNFTLRLLLGLPSFLSEFVVKLHTHTHTHFVYAWQIRVFGPSFTRLP